jgi:hypothetical protein
MASHKKLIEYRVRDVSRYIVTRYETGPEGGSLVEKGEYENRGVAFEVAYALCKEEHGRLGWPLDDERIQYPRWSEDAATEIKV